MRKASHVGNAKRAMIEARNNRRWLVVGFGIESSWRAYCAARAAKATGVMTLKCLTMPCITSWMTQLPLT